MEKALLISIHPEWAEKILNGKKTIEIRTWIPKDYAGWVYVAITKDNYTNHLYKKDDVWTLTEKNIYHYPYKNICGKVAFRFWYKKVEEIVAFGDKAIIEKNRQILKLACLTPWQANEYLLKDPLDRSTRLIGYAWHIDNLEIFDKPKELSEFNIYCNKHGKHGQCKCDNCKRLKLSFINGVFGGEYCDNKLTKAPQKCAWVYGG